MIPKILHQTWKTPTLPPEWVPFAESWKSFHPGWEYRFWTDDDNRALVASEYPDLLGAYDSYPYAIQRADLARYCMLHRFGGIYADMDIECLQPLDTLIAGQSCFLVREPDSQAAALGEALVVSNAFLAAEPGHPFLTAILDALRSERRRAVTHRDVLELTGPLLVTRVFDAHSYLNLSLLDAKVAFSLTSKESAFEALRTRQPGHEALRARLVEAGAYAVHYWANTWVGTLAGALVNPEPHAIPGYDFFPGLDSPGQDITNVGRDIRAAALRCLELPEAVAFNTDGFAKRRLIPRHQWQPMGNGATDEGLYVKKRSGFKALIEGVLRR